MLLQYFLVTSVYNLRHLSKKNLVNMLYSPLDIEADKLPSEHESLIQG